MKPYLKVGILLASLLLTTQQVLAQSKNLNVQSNQSGDRRIALVIGNDAYQSVSRLENARSDARAIAKSLEQSGFAVTLKLDVSERGMKEAVRNFKNSVNGGDVVVFYYSGHGVQLGAANYLLPTDIRGDNEDQVKDEAVPLQRVLDDLQDQKAKFALAIVDACRDNPFKGTGKRAIGGRGLAPTTAASGQMILFSAGAGQQALDKVGANDRSTNGLFTRVLLSEMEKPGVPVDTMLRDVRERVVAIARSVNHDQVPALYDQAIGRFYFRSADSAQNTTQTQTPAILRDSEEEAWIASKNANTSDAYDAYLSEYPRGRYASAARIAKVGLRATALSTNTSGIANRTSQSESTSLALAPSAAPASIAASSLRRVKVGGPDIADNGSVVPVTFEFDPSLRSAEAVTLLLDGREIARLQVNEGTLRGFATRIRMPESGTVSAKCSGCQVESKLIRVTIPDNPSTSAGTLESMRIRIQGNILRVLAGVDGVNDGVATVSNPSLKATLLLTGYLSKNPFFQIDGSFSAGRENTCMTLLVGGQTRQDCASSN